MRLVAAASISCSTLLLCLQVLEREERSLGSLLEDFCSVRKQKQHQRADWRQR